MKVKVLIQCHTLRRADGSEAQRGDIIECPGHLGNPWACIGLVEVVEHDKPPKLAPRSTVQPTPEALRHLERETGKDFGAEEAEENAIVVPEPKRTRRI